MSEWNHRNGPSWPFHWVSAILDSVVDLKRVLVRNLFLVIRHLFFLKWIVLQSVIFTLSEVLVIHVRGLIIIHNNYCGNNKGQSTQHSWQQSKEEINFLRVAGIQGTNYHRRKIVSNGSILWYGLFLKPTQASKVRLIWNTQTSPMALFLITGVPICGEKSSVDWNSGKCSAILRKMILALHGNISNEVFGGSTVS